MLTWLRTRPLALLLPAIAIVVAAAVVSRANNGKQATLADEWFTRGQQQSSAGQTGAAIDAYRTSLAYAPQPQCELQLARALAKSGQYAEARSYLLDLWRSEPGDGEINLELARLAVMQNRPEDAMRYYHAAIYGTWDEDALQHRSATRQELVKLLISRKMIAQADAELVAIAADLPDDSAAHANVGRLMLQTGDLDHAAVQFQQALKLNKRNADAWLGAGEAAYRQADYPRARRTLNTAVQLEPENAAAKSLLQNAELVANVNPFVFRISTAERNRRIVDAWSSAQARVASCIAAQAPGTQPPAELVAANTQLAALKSQATLRALARDPDAMQSIMATAFSAEATANKYCGQPQGKDLALTLIARLRESRE
jgi:tetratricopeptide (TPR) repeat protein